MVNENQKQELQALLGQLSEDQVEKLVSVMDAARSEKTMAASSELIMSMLRPSLLHTKPRRLQTPLRILCDPFEDLLVPLRPNGKETTKISRTSIMPMWKWVQDIGGVSFAETCNDFAEAVKNKNQAQQWESACHIWSQAEKIMRPEIERAVEDGAYNSELAKRFGEADCIDDVREMLELIRIGAIVESLKEELPAKPVMKMGQEHIGLIKNSYSQAAETIPGSEPWLIVSVMRRLLHEAEILKVIKSLSNKGDDTLASMTDMSLIGELVISEVEGYVVMIGQIFEEKNRDLDIMELTGEYMISFAEVTSNLDIKREGAWGKRMLMSRKKIGNYITKAVLDGAPAKVMGGFTMTKRKMGNTISKVIDMREAPDGEKYLIAERRAKAVKKCQLFADRLGLKTLSQNIVGETIKELEQFEDKMLDVLRRVGADEREIASQHIIMTAHIQEILMGPDAADLFRKRALGLLS